MGYWQDSGPVEAENLEIVALKLSDRHVFLESLHVPSLKLAVLNSFEKRMHVLQRSGIRGSLPVGRRSHRNGRSRNSVGQRELLY